jgi:hypothetical protein
MNKTQCSDSECQNSAKYFLKFWPSYFTDYGGLCEFHFKMRPMRISAKAISEEEYLVFSVMNR